MNPLGIELSNSDYKIIVSKPFKKVYVIRKSDNKIAKEWNLANNDDRTIDAIISLLLLMGLR